MDKVKLGNYIEKVSIKASDIDDYSNLEPLGVSNVDGITTTSHVKSSDLSKYLYIEENYFAYNPYRINVGSIGLTPKGVQGLVSPAYIVFKTKETLLPEILFDFLKSFDGLQQINKLARGTVRKALRYDDLCEIELVVPSIEKQNKILSLKNNINHYTSKLDQEISRQQELLKKLRQSILQDAIEGKLTASWRQQSLDIENTSILLEKIKAEKDQLIKEKKIKKQKTLPPINDEEIPFDIPDSWEWCRMGNITNKITDGTHHSPINDENGTYKYITAKNIKKNGIDLSNITYVSQEVHNEIYARCNPEKGDILYIKDGATTGIVTINNLDEEFSMLSSVALIKLGSHIYNKYLMFVMKSPFFYDLIRADMSGVAITRVTLKKIQNTFFPLPSLKEQKQIVEKVESLFACCDELEEQINNSKTNTETLMQAVLKEAFEK